MKFKIFIAFIIASAMLAFTGCQKKNDAKNKITQVSNSPVLATVITLPVDSVKGSMAWCGGNITGEGQSHVISAGVCWDTKTGPTTQQSHTYDHAGTGVYKSVMGNLAPGTVYYMRAYATNAGGTAYGNEITFKTQAGWVETGQELAGNNITINALAVINNIVFAGTNRGVFRSADNQGTHWILLGSGLSNVMAIAASGNNIFAGTSPDGIFLSTNAGNSWSPVNNGLYGLEMDIRCLAASGTNVFAGTGQGMLVSANSGDNWSLAGSSVISGSPLSLAVSGSNVYLSTFSQERVFKSADNGSSWAVASSGIGTTESVFALSVSGANILAGTNSGLYLSSNNGASWDKNTSLQSNDITSFATRDNLVYVAEAGKLYVSKNNGNTFAEVNNSAYTSVANLTMNDTYVFGTNGYSIFRFPVDQ